MLRKNISVQKSRTFVSLVDTNSVIVITIDKANLTYTETVKKNTKGMATSSYTMNYKT